MKRVLLTGASGFIGSHCVESLLRLDYEVHALSSQEPHQSSANIIWHQADLRVAGHARRVMESVKPTHLLHLAWFVVPGKLISSPENFGWVTSSFELIRDFADLGGARVVVCGSGYEYDWNYGYCSERLTPTVPNTVYGCCKNALHELLRSFGDLNGLSNAWGRVFFLYGPREHPDRLVSSVIRSLLKGEAARCSHGRQIRDYMHVQDVANGLVTLLDSNVQGAINVCSGQATTLRDIVLSIGRICQRPELVQLGAISARANDTPLVVGDNARLTSETGWKQQLDLEAGLCETVDWWRQHLA
jgi:nucleoside-diphosphate-sugar epimerase